jgi:two-component system NarL family response regulator
LQFPRPNAEKIRIVVADDHPITREGLTLVLNAEIDMAVIAEVSSGREAVEAYRRLRPDVAILDLQMSDMSGPEAIEVILGDFKQARTIVLTTYDGDEDVYRALRAGARAYLLKTALRNELTSTIRMVHAGQRSIAPSIGAKLAQRLESEALSGREMAVLRLIAQGKANKVIASELGISEGTVRTHVTNVLAKMGTKSRTEAAMVAVSRGLLRG